MKSAKILLTICVTCLLATVSVRAQARIDFANDSNTRIYIGFGGDPNSFTVLGTASTATFGIGPASVEIRLFAGTTSTFLSPVLIGTAANQQFVLNTASTVAGFQGLFSGGTVLPLPGFDGSTPAYLQMTMSTLIGGVPVQSYSPIIQVTPLLSPNLPTPVFGPPGTPDAWDATDWGYEGTGPGAYTLRIGAVPEPSAMGLTAASFALMFLRRRKMAERLPLPPASYG